MPFFSPTPATGLSNSRRISSAFGSCFSISAGDSLEREGEATSNFSPCSPNSPFRDYSDGGHSTNATTSFHSRGTQGASSSNYCPRPFGYGVVLTRDGQRKSPFHFIHLFPEVNHSFLQVLPMCTHCIVSEFPKCIFRRKGKSCEQCQTGKRSKCTFNVSPGQLIQATDLLAAATRGSKFGKSMDSFARFLLN